MMIVVAGVDGSDQTHRVVEAALEYAAAGKVHFVYVSNGSIYPYAIPAGVMIDYAAIEKGQEEAVWQKVGRVRLMPNRSRSRGHPLNLSLTTPKTSGQI